MGVVDLVDSLLKLSPLGRLVDWGVGGDGVEGTVTVLTVRPRGDGFCAKVMLVTFWVEFLGLEMTLGRDTVESLGV